MNEHDLSAEEQMRQAEQEGLTAPLPGAEESTEQAASSTAEEQGTDTGSVAPDADHTPAPPVGDDDDDDDEKVQCYCGAVLAADDDEPCRQCGRGNDPAVRKPPAEWGRTSGGVN